MHGCIISACIWHLRSLKITTSASSEDHLTVCHCHLNVCHCHFTVPSHCVSLSFHCAISLCVTVISLCRLTVSSLPSHFVISLCHLTVSSLSFHCVSLSFHCAISLCRQCLLTVSSLSFHCVVIVVNILDQITKQTSRKSPPCCLGLRLRAWHQTSHTYWAGAPTLSAFCCTSKGPQSPACVCVCVCVCMCVYVCVSMCVYVCVCFYSHNAANCSNMMFTSSSIPLLCSDCISTL